MELDGILYQRSFMITLCLIGIHYVCSMNFSGSKFSGLTEI